MSVELFPEELGFQRPFNHEVTQVLRITNRNTGPVAFKVKTTAPKQYCVRPNSGVVRPNGSVEVQVLLQAMKEDPPIDARCRDKFLVQSVVVADEADDNNVATLWSNVEKTNKASIQEKKIRVSFLAPGELNQLNGGGANDEPPAYSSPTPVYGSPAPASVSDMKSSGIAESTRSGSTSYNAAATSGSAMSGPMGTSGTSGTPNASNASGPSGGSGVVAAVSNAIPRSQDDVSQQLAAAQATIKDLTNQLSDPQVRQRKVAEAQEKVQTIVQQTQETGVPLHITAALCFVSFLIAYLFF